VKHDPQIEMAETAHRFVVTAKSSSGATFIATFPVCGCSRTPCVAEHGHGRSVKNAAPGCDGSNAKGCHALRGHSHREHVEHFMAKLARTYTPNKPRPKDPPGVTDYMRRNRAIAPCPAWPVADDGPLPASCNCESCQSTLALGGRA
jgi:hypothetical protein